ncbi:MAG: PRC-barrel domain-containing protein [Hyphomicrobiaceae bacterium]|nr:PRC-barrel domain-containing protein [Hyphomicrobiaceae bacterium]
MPTATGHTTAIRATRVIGTDVYNANHQKIGEIEDIMLDKSSNNIMFAVISFGGFLGIGEKYHPVPWSILDYEKDAGGYVVGLSKDQLKAAPAHSLSDLAGGDGQRHLSDAFNYYKVPPYWNA